MLLLNARISIGISQALKLFLGMQYNQDSLILAPSLVIAMEFMNFADSEYPFFFEYSRNSLMYGVRV